MLTTFACSTYCSEQEESIKIDQIFKETDTVLASELSKINPNEWTSYSVEQNNEKPTRCHTYRSKEDKQQKVQILLKKEKIEFGIGKGTEEVCLMGTTYKKGKETLPCSAISFNDKTPSAFLPIRVNGFLIASGLLSE